MKIETKFKEGMYIERKNPTRYAGRYCLVKSVHNKTMALNDVSLMQPFLSDIDNVNKSYIVWKPKVGEIVTAWNNDGSYRWISKVEQIMDDGKILTNGGIFENFIPLIGEDITLGEDEIETEPKEKFAYLSTKMSDGKKICLKLYHTIIGYRYKTNSDKVCIVCDRKYKKSEERGIWFLEKHGCKDCAEKYN